MRESPNRSVVKIVHFIISTCWGATHQHPSSSIHTYSFSLGRWVPAGTSTEPKINLENLLPEKEYKFRVMAVNSEGASEPLEADQSIIAKSKYGTF